MPTLPTDPAVLAALVFCGYAWLAVAAMLIVRPKLEARKTDETPAADTLPPCAAAQSGETLARAIAYQRAMRDGARIATLYRSR